MDKLVLRKGTIIHLVGMPFELAQETIVLGKLENMLSLEALSGMVTEPVIAKSTKVVKERSKGKR